MTEEVEEEYTLLDLSPALKDFDEFITAYCKDDCDHCDPEIDKQCVGLMAECITETMIDLLQASLMMGLRNKRRC